MKLQSIGYLISSLTMTFIVLLALAFYQYSSLGDRLLNTDSILDEISQTTHRIQIEALCGKSSRERAQKIIAKINQLSHSLRKYDLSPKENNRLIDLEISIVRIGRILDQPRGAKQSTPGPLFKQIENETIKISRASRALMPLVRNRIEREQGRARFLISFFYFILCLCSIGVVVFLSRSIISPVLRLSREIKEVQQGLRDNIAPAVTHNEIGSLVSFTRNTISSIQSRCQTMSAYSQIMELLVVTRTLDELLHQALTIILSLDWFKIEDKGAVFLINQSEPETLILRSSVNFSAEILRSCARVPFGKCICGRTAVSRRLIHTVSVDKRHDILYPGMLDHGHYCVPLLSGEELLGVMVFYLPAGRAAHPEEEEFLKGVANILSESITRKRLEEQQALISTAITQAAEGVVITDTRGNIQYANPFMTEMTGYSPEEIIASNPRIFKSGKHDEKLYRQLWQTITSGEKWEGVLTNKKKDGSLYEEKIIITPVENENGKISHFVAIKQDISKEKKLEQQLIQSQKLEAIGTLAGGIAHDFNNILTAIFGFTQLAKVHLPPESHVQEDLDQVLSGAKRAKELVKHILTFSRKTENTIGPIRISLIIKEVIKMLRASIPATIEIEDDIAADSGVISADPTQVHQILMNLCTNAAQAMEESGGKLTVSLANVEITGSTPSECSLRPGQYVKLIVADTGPGIAPEVKARIFDPFFTTKEVGRGTGMGLSVVHGIVENSGGGISVESTLNKGTKFSIYLPRIAAREDTPETASTTPTGHENILFVDDEEVIVEVAARMLEGLGYKVTALADSEEGLKIFQAQPKAFDLIISDQTMPHLTGYEMIREILKIRPDIPTILCTGHSSQVDREKAVKHGITEFLLKPIKFEELAVTIRSVLDSRKSG
ncbi:response regulator [Desulfobacterota bacterium M19]